jgi:methyl-accepting chemotaxis protein
VSRSRSEGTGFLSRIGTRLTASFALLVLVIAGLAAFGIRTLATMDDAERDSETLSSGAFAALRLGEAKQQQRVYMAEYAVDQDPDDIKQYNIEQENADKDRAEVLEYVSDTEVRKLLEEVDGLNATQRKTWEDEILPQINRGDAAGAQDKLEAVEELISEQIEVVHEINEVLAEDVAAQSDGVRDDNHRLRTLFWVAGSIAVLLALVLAVLVTRSIVRPIRRLKVVSDRVAGGDLEGLVVDTSGRDEIAELAGSINNVVAAFEVMYESLGQPTGGASHGSDDLETARR